MVQSQMRRSPPGWVTSTRPCHGSPMRGRARTRWSEISLGDNRRAWRWRPSACDSVAMPKSRHPAWLTCRTRPCRSTSASGSGLESTMAWARSAAARAPVTASDSSSPPAMYAATAARYRRSTSPNAGGAGSTASGCSYRTTPTAPTTPLEVLSGAIIAPRARRAEQPTRQLDQECPQPPLPLQRGAPCHHYREVRRDLHARAQRLRGDALGKPPERRLHVVTLRVVVIGDAGLACLGG